MYHITRLFANTHRKILQNNINASDEVIHALIKYKSMQYVHRLRAMHYYDTNEDIKKLIDSINTSDYISCEYLSKLPMSSCPYDVLSLYALTHNYDNVAQLIWSMGKVEACSAAKKYYNNIFTYFEIIN